MSKIYIYLLVIAILSACSEKAEFDAYQPISDFKWHKDSVIRFNYEPLDTVSKNNIYVNIRNNNAYVYSNLYLIVDIEFPNSTKVTDTLEYEMATAEGKFLGKGLTDLKENKLEYKTNVVFPNSGIYRIGIQHAMRKAGEIEGLEFLDGITDVGLRIEKNTSDE